MSEYTDQLASIVEDISSITDIGRVHDRPRYGDAYEHWVTRIDGIEQIRAWEVGVEDPGLEVIRVTQNHRHRQRHWLVRGYVGLEDETATYKTIIDLADQIAEVIDADRHLNGTAPRADTCIDLNAPTQISEPAVITIGGGALCWGIELRFIAYTIVQP